MLQAIKKITWVAFYKRNFLALVSLSVKYYKQEDEIAILRSMPLPLFKRVELRTAFELYFHTVCP